MRSKSKDACYDRYKRRKSEKRIKPVGSETTAKRSQESDPNSRQGGCGREMDTGNRCGVILELLARGILEEVRL